MKTAQELRDTFIKSQAQSSIDQFVEKLTKLAEEGKGNEITTKSLTVTQKRHLEEKGYKVEFMPSDFRDPRDDSYYKISFPL